MTPSLTSSRSHQADVNHPHENFSEVLSTNFCFLKIVLLQSPPPTTKDVQSFIFMNLRVLSTTIFPFDPLYFYLIHPLILKISVSGGNLAEICIKHTTYWIFFANNIHIRESWSRNISIKIPTIDIVAKYLTWPMWFTTSKVSDLKSSLVYISVPVHKQNIWSKQNLKIYFVNMRDRC